MLQKTGTLIALMLCLISTLAGASEPAAQTPIEYQHTGQQYPPVLFVTNIEDGGFKERLESYKAFSRLDTEAVGLPIGVRMLKGHRRKQDGTQFSSLMLSASTLGLTPVVSNTEFMVHYDVFVQGKSIAKFKYEVVSTDVDNLWTAPYNERETKPAEVLFMEHTLVQFLNDLKESSDVQAVFDEYWAYFGDER